MGIRNWPEEKRKLFSMAVAIILTIGIVIFWYVVKYNTAIVTDPNSVPVTVDYFGDTLDNLHDELSKFQEVFGSTSTTSSSTDMVATTTATSSPETNSDATSTQATNNI